jgi:selenocysteine-specific elongation factor
MVATRIVIGTAGHVDHGKTTLVRALTGTDTDRLPEEKARGISIELGFAPLELGDGRAAAVVDVPGHEKFVRTMVAGATGIDLALFVIAADEGVMPQTREHLDVCRLLGVGRGVIALTKIDLVDSDLRRLARDELQDAVRGTFLEAAPVVPCSAVTGEGLPALRSTLARAVSASPARSADGTARLPVDRVFTVKGFGTVVTGTLASGRLASGASVEVLPAGAHGPIRGKIRSLEVHGAPREAAEAGERVAANVHGIAREAIARGDVLAPEGMALASATVEVELQALPACPAPLANRARLLFHALATHQEATVLLLGPSRLEPGASALAQVHLTRPVALLPGDRFILRGFRPLPGHGSTVAGGRIVRIDARRLKRGSPAEHERLRRISEASPDTRIGLEVAMAGRAGLTLDGLRMRLGAPKPAVERAVHKLLSQGQAITVDAATHRLVSATALEAPRRELVAALERFHAREPLRSGMPREQLRGCLRGAAAIDQQVFDRLIAGLVRDGLIEIDSDHHLVRRAGFSTRDGEAEREGLLARVRAVLAAQGLAPPSPAALADVVGAPPAEAKTALEILVRRGELVRLKSDLFFDREAISRLGASLRRFLATHDQITAQEFKALTGQSRKFAIPLAEHFDEEKLTLRVGEVRRLRESHGAAHSPANPGSNRS